ncbi:hypothetical protein GD1_219 [Paraglaciecola Antarctic GD virus 1]|nr:hypothetical protein GD1_219 [Paraglaciecola Antarctic GD virus 1]
MLENFSETVMNLLWIFALCYVAHCMYMLCYDITAGLIGKFKCRMWNRKHPFNTIEKIKADKAKQEIYYALRQFHVSDDTRMSNELCAQLSAHLFKLDIEGKK